MRQSPHGCSSTPSGTQIVNVLSRNQRVLHRFQYSNFTDTNLKLYQPTQFVVCQNLNFDNFVFVIDSLFDVVAGIFPTGNHENQSI